MNIEEFVSQTLIQITKGIRKAQAETLSEGALVSPHHRYDAERQAHIKNQLEDTLEQVEFDIAVTTQAASGGKGGVQLAVFSAQLNGTESSGTVSRVKFNLFVEWPRIHVEANRNAASELCEAGQALGLAQKEGQGEKR